MSSTMPSSEARISCSDSTLIPKPSPSAPAASSASSAASAVRSPCVGPGPVWLFASSCSPSLGPFALLLLNPSAPVGSQSQVTRSCRGRDGLQSLLCLGRRRRRRPTLARAAATEAATEALPSSVVVGAEAGGVSTTRISPKALLRISRSEEVAVVEAAAGREAAEDDN